jgi:hypothetical protein
MPEILRTHGDSLKGEIRKCLPATVTAVHPSRQTVDVQLGVNAVMFDELGTTVGVPAPSISEVPLGVLRGGGFLIWVPVAVGDYVLLIFSDLSCDTWRALPAGSAGNPVDPGFVGQHTHDSPFAIPMVAPDAKAFVSPGTDRVIIGKDNSDEQISIGASDIELGRGATDFVGLASKIDANLTTLNTYLSTLALPVSGATAGPPALPPWSLISGPPSVAATLVKAK